MRKPRPARYHCINKHWVRSGLTVLLLILCTSTALPVDLHAQRNDIRFEEISIEEGLSQTIVFCIAQDSKGFMWFGTEDGLNKYDGHRFTIIRHIPDDPSSLAYNHILSLYEDRTGTLWIGTFLAGLDRYDSTQDRFIHYRHDPKNPNSLSHDMIRTIYEDLSGTLWIGTDGGLNRFNRETETFTRYIHYPDDANTLSHNTVRAICEDRTGMLWIGTEGGGLNKFDRDTETFTHYIHDPSNPKSLSSNSVRAIYEDNAGKLWIGTDGGGLNKLDRDTETFFHFLADPNDPSKLSHNSVYALYEDKTGVLWIGTNGGGLNILDQERRKFIRYINDPNDPTSLSYNEIYHIYEDRSGVLWIGTYGGGVNKIDLKRKKFIHYRYDPNNPNSLSHPIVWSIHEDASGILWIGTHGGGVNRFDRVKNQYTHYRHNPNDPYSLSNDIVRNVYEDRSGVLWIGTHGGGICRFDRETGKFFSYQNDPNDPSSLSNDEIRSIYEDRSGTFWIGTNGGGFNKFDRETGKFTRYQNDPDNRYSLSNDFVRVIYEDREGSFWIGTQGGGLNKFDRTSGLFTQYRTDPDNPNSLSSDFVFSIHEDESGLLWLGTWGGGLNKFDPKTETFTAYTENEGLSSNSTYGALEDDEGNLWISTNNGLSKFNPITGTFKNYNERDGLQSNEFNGGSFFQSKSGEMFFGGILGFNAFFPHEIKDNPHIPPVVITTFTKLNKEAKLDKPLAELDELVLSYRDYVFSFEFAALEFTAPDKNLYAYKMEGLDEDWIYTDSDKRFANYTTLPPGRYVFRVKASNNDGIWNEEGISIKISITPPFWQTWWFRSVAVLALLGLALTWYKRRVHTMRMKIELQTAHDAQMSIMPQTVPDITDFEISSVCIPASEVGGDFYDYFWLNKEKSKLGVAIGDVSGKAMKAAVIAIMSSGMINSRADETSSPKEILALINRSVYRKTDELMFTALCFATIDVPTKKFTYTIAGFNAPLLKSSNSVIRLDRAGHGVPLGAFDDSTYNEDTVRLKSEDVLVLFTDGITDAKNNSKEFYGDDRLINLLKKTDASDQSAHEIKSEIVADVKGFIGSTQQEDDMTIVVIKAV